LNVHGSFPFKVGIGSTVGRFSKPARRTVLH
jgi:hypothetical protein